MAPTNPAARVAVRVNSVYTRKASTGKAFMSLNLSDTMAPGYERLPEADFVNFALDNTVWTALLKEIQKHGAKSNKGTDAKGRTYLSFKPKVVELVIELDKALAVENVDRKTTNLSIKGNVVGITVREKGTGNGIRLDD